MPRKPRVFVEGGIYNVYNRFGSGEAVFADPEEALARALVRIDPGLLAKIDPRRIVVIPAGGGSEGAEGLRTPHDAGCRSGSGASSVGSCSGRTGALGSVSGRAARRGVRRRGVLGRRRAGVGETRTTSWLGD